MGTEIRPKIGKKVFITVSVVALIFLAAGAVLGIWSASEMRDLVGEQFNAQQLVLAGQVSTLIEKQIHFLERELLFLQKQFDPGTFAPEEHQDQIQQAFHRVLESGVWKIEILDLEITKVMQRLKARNIVLQLDEKAKDFLVSRGYDPQYGARPLKRVLQREILNKLSKMILANEINKDQKIVISRNKNQLVFSNS